MPVPVGGFGEPLLDEKALVIISMINYHHPSFRESGFRQVERVLK